jgi:hypothetical protein
MLAATIAFSARRPSASRIGHTTQRYVPGRKEWARPPYVHEEGSVSLGAFVRRSKTMLLSLKKATE